MLQITVTWPELRYY